MRHAALGSLVCYQASFQTDAKRHSLFFLFFPFHSRGSWHSCTDQQPGCTHTSSVPLLCSCGCHILVLVCIGAVLHPAPEQTAKDPLRPAQNGFKPNQRTGSLRPATRIAVKALPVGLHRNPRRPGSQDTARVQAVARNAAAQSVPPGVVDLIAAAQREIDAASASAEQLIRENDFAEDGLDLDFDAFLESDGIAELVAQAQATTGPLPAVQHTPSRLNAHARRARSPATSQMSPAVTPASRDAVADTTTATPLSPARPAPSSLPAPTDGATAVPALSVDTVPTASKTALAQPAASAVAATTAGAAQPEAVSTGAAPAATAAAGASAATTASTTAAVKEAPKGNAKQKRAHKNADAIRYNAM